MTRRVLEAFWRKSRRCANATGVLRPAGVSTFGREMIWREHRTATADGHRRGRYPGDQLLPRPPAAIPGPDRGITLAGCYGI